MMVPNLLGKKVVYPVIVYIICQSFVSSMSRESLAFIFGLVYLTFLKLDGDLVYTQADIIVPTLIFYTFPVSIDWFILLVGFSRLLFPNM